MLSDIIRLFVPQIVYNNPEALESKWPFPEITSTTSTSPYPTPTAPCSATWRGRFCISLSLILAQLSAVHMHSCPQGPRAGLGGLSPRQKSGPLLCHISLELDPKTLWQGVEWICLPPTMAALISASDCFSSPASLHSLLPPPPTWPQGKERRKGGCF